MNTPSADPQATLARKMALTMGDLRRIAKDGENKDQKWKYATIDDITDAVRGAMANNGLALFTSMKSCATEVAGTTRSGGNVTRATVVLQFKIVCGETGASEIMEWTGVADDYSDKAVNKAGTYATKFWMKNTFLISTGDDPDAESPEVAQPKKPAHWSEDPDVMKRLYQRAAERQWIEKPSDLLELINKASWYDFTSFNEAAQAIKEAGEALEAQREQMPAPEAEPTPAPDEPPASDVIRGKPTTTGSPFDVKPSKLTPEEMKQAQQDMELENA